MTIESLALEKNFADLTLVEQDFVLSEMTQEAFEHLRTVLMAARQLDAGLEPPRQLKAQLLEKMAAQHRPHLLVRAFSTPVPLWQAAAALLALIGLWLVKPAQIQVQVQTRTEIQQRTDTVWLEKIQWRERIVVREQPPLPPKEPLALAPFVADTLSTLANPTGWSLPRVGTSLGDTPELMDFFTQGD